MDAKVAAPRSSPSALEPVPLVPPPRGSPQVEVYPQVEVILTSDTSRSSHAILLPLPIVGF